MARPKIKINPGINDLYNTNNSLIIIENSISKPSTKDKNESSTPAVNAAIENWDELTPTEKSETVWIWSLVEKKLSFLDDDYNKFVGKGSSGTNFELPQIYSGNGVAWLEPYIYGVTSPTCNPKNGVFVSVKPTPKVIGYE